MASSQFSQSIAPYVSLITTVGVLIALVGALSYLAAYRFGGKTRLKRQLVFFGVSTTGLLFVLYFAYLRLASHV